VIAAANLTRRFGDRVAVEALTFSVHRREIVALLGPNGAGKTTTLRMLAGLIAPTDGRVSIDGAAMNRANGAALRRRIGFLTEAPGLWDRLTVRENLAIYAGLYDLDRNPARVDQLLGALALSDHAHRRTAELSKGMRQKVALVRALLHDPEVLLLDEPTAGLDPEVTRTVRGLLQARRAAGCAILVSTHNLDEAERIADRVAVIRQRLMAIDTPAALRRRLTTGQIMVRLDRPAEPFVGVAAGLASEVASADGPWLVVTMADTERQTPELVKGLVAAGAAILEVRPQRPDLEDVYLRLLDQDSPRGGR
jgi:ABC-2 type transport system ATP-binding protein